MLTSPDIDVFRVVSLDAGQTPKQIFSQPHPARTAAAQGAHSGLLVSALSNESGDAGNERSKSPSAASPLAASSPKSSRLSGRKSPDHGINSGLDSPKDIGDSGSIHSQ